MSAEPTAADGARHRAILSVLDVVQEMAEGLAVGQTPTRDWADIVVTSFNEHREELRATWGS